MGVTEAAAAVIAALLVGAGLTWALERFLARAAWEAGAARHADLRQSLELPNADRWLLPAGPVVALAGVALAAVVVPFGPGLVGRDLGIGLFYVIVVVDFVVLGLSMAGWGANTPDAVEACYRIVAQLVAYVVPLGLAYVGVVMMSRSLSTLAVVDAQRDLWFVVLQPLGFLLYIVTGLMQSYRAPFLEPFAASIGGGVLGVAGGWSAILWRVALAGVLFVVAAIGAVLYLGGPSGPGMPGWTWMLIKTYALMALMLGLGRCVRPLSTADMLALSWKVLIPAGLVNVLLVGTLILLGVGPQP
ncbi:NADH-quinone oxidoreductase subunit H [Methylorubrum populi]|uniref:NADH-quinone oxidoreductase subunit H n=1 Tax=Methylorubrum rhodesianum TaxID=29427 RepID=A0ABU9Z4Y6_9HYPH|nr:NADH-quinone oxidoreductase subunit H [Methylorubrum rhodesianum]MBK3404063.1 NADH-quinone oxidoreductase subunit H [Methylorubrum rhodesianum]MBY0143396.1 NADH-quinone oxidoreductase subunit H [Methylorubrum populi]